MGTQHLGDHQRQLLVGERDPGLQGQRLGLAVDQVQRCCPPQGDVYPATTLDGAKQVLLTDILSRPHDDLIWGTFGRWAYLPIQDGGPHLSQLGSDRRQGTGLVPEPGADSPERLGPVQPCPGMQGGRVQPPG